MLTAGHTLLYRAGNDSRIDRWNIALLKRIVRKSTTRTQLEIYYHEPAKLLDWAEPADSVRYVRLRSGEDFPFAERIAAAATDTVVVLDDALLLSAGDIWRLMGLAERHAVVVVDVRKAHKNPAETLIHLLWRSAKLALKNYLFPEGTSNAEAFAVCKSLLRTSHNITPGSFYEKKSYADYLRSASPAKPQIIRGDSFAVRKSAARPLLATGAATVQAFKIWQRDKVFPWWFSGSFLIFHVAQLAAYYGALVFFISPKASLVVFLFAILITPQFFFQRLSWRRPHHALAQMATRFWLYLFG